MIFTSSYKVLFKAFLITTTTKKMIYAVAQMCSVKVFLEVLPQAWNYI